MKIKATLPKTDHDGLSPVELRIEKLQQIETVVVAVLHTESRIEDIETGDFELVLKIRRIEAMVDPHDVQLATLLLQKRFEKRTGVTRLPINDDKTFKDEFYTAAQARGWTVEEDGTITIPGGGLTIVDDLTVDPDSGEVLGNNPADDPSESEPGAGKGRKK